MEIKTFEDVSLFETMMIFQPAMLLYMEDKTTDCESTQAPFFHVWIKFHPPT